MSVCSIHTVNTMWNAKRGDGGFHDFIVRMNYKKRILGKPLQGVDDVMIIFSLLRFAF